MAAAGGFHSGLILERFVLVHRYPEHAEGSGHLDHLHLGLTAYIGLSFHSLLDGLAISSTYTLPQLGGVVLLKLVDFPSESIAVQLLCDRRGNCRNAATTCETGCCGLIGTTTRVKSSSGLSRSSQPGLRKGACALYQSRNSPPPFARIGAAVAS